MSLRLYLLLKPGLKSKYVSAIPQISSLQRSKDGVPDHLMSPGALHTALQVRSEALRRASWGGAQPKWQAEHPPGTAQVPTEQSVDSCHQGAGADCEQSHAKL